MKVVLVQVLNLELFCALHLPAEVTVLLDSSGKILQSKILGSKHEQCRGRLKPVVLKNERM